MSHIILEGHCRYNASIPKMDFYSRYGKENYHARMLIDVKSEICCTQTQFISYETKPTFWTKDELLVAFNEAYKNIELYVKTDMPITIFTENIFHPEVKKLETSELKEDFQIEIPENMKIVKNLCTDLLRIKEAEINFDKCKDKLFTVMAWGPNLLNHYHYNINRVIDYLSSVTNASVVTVPNNENISHIRGAFDELLKT